MASNAARDLREEEGEEGEFIERKGGSSEGADEIPSLDASGVPEWARGLVPEDLPIPAGIKLTFMRMRSSLTRRPEIGVPTTWLVRNPNRRDDGDPKFVEEVHISRVVIMWELSVAEERLAIKRAIDDADVTSSLAKAFVRAVDGKIADTSGTWAHRDKRESMISTDAAWDQFGPKLRAMILNAYRQAHTLSSQEMADFFMQGHAVVSSRAG